MDVNVDALDYEKSKKYWSEIPATTDGVLGGFSEISDIDITYTKRFLNSLSKMQDAPAPCFGRALDVGAGIGRISKHALSVVFKKVDLLEQDEKFMNEARRVLQKKDDGRLNCENFFCTGIMDFNPGEIKYDVIWIQWVLGYLIDDDLVEFLKRCCTWLNPLGVIAIKENMSQVKEGEIDEIDSSVTRSYLQFCEIFKRANLKCILQRQQKNFPDGLYKVLMFALRPKNV